MILKGIQVLDLKLFVKFKHCFLRLLFYSWIIRDVEVWLELLGVRHKIYQRGLEQIRFDRTDAVAFHRRETSIFLECSAEIEEGFPLRLAEVADVHPGQDDFPGPGLSGLASLDEGGGDVPRAGASPCEGNGAEGTEIITSVLHLEETARAEIGRAHV